MRIAHILAPALLALFLVPQAAANDALSVQERPQFSLAWSEWPGWSVFGVAHEIGLIDKAAGKLGPVEQQYGVDIVLHEMEYDPCINGYANGEVDAACLTNMDSLAPSLLYQTVAILLCDTSEGGDMWLTTNPNLTWESLSPANPLEVHGLENSVSHYVGVRLLERHGKTEDCVRWINKDPGAAAMAMQQDQLASAIVWNPFCLNVLAQNKQARVFGSSKEIPGEIWDLVVVRQESLSRPGGYEFALAILDVYYRIMDRIADPATRDETVAAIGEKFSRLPIEEMRKVLDGTKYVMTPEAAVDFLTGPDARVTMDRVTGFCMAHLKLARTPVTGFGTAKEMVSAFGKPLDKADFRVDPSYLRAFVASRKAAAGTDGH